MKEFRKKEVLYFGIFVAVLFLAAAMGTNAFAAPNVDITIQVNGNSFNKGDFIFFQTSTYINGIVVLSLPMEAELVYPDGTVEDLSQRDSFKGYKQGNITLEKSGDYILRVSAIVNGQRFVQERAINVKKPNVGFELESPESYTSSEGVVGRITLNVEAEVSLLFKDPRLQYMIPVCNVNCSFGCDFACAMPEGIEERSFVLVATTEVEGDSYLTSESVFVGEGYNSECTGVRLVGSKLLSNELASISSLQPNTFGIEVFGPSDYYEYFEGQSFEFYPAYGGEYAFVSYSNDLINGASKVCKNSLVAENASVVNDIGKISTRSIYDPLFGETWLEYNFKVKSGKNRMIFENYQNNTLGQILGSKLVDPAYNKVSNILESNEDAELTYLAKAVKSNVSDDTKEAKILERVHNNLRFITIDYLSYELYKFSSYGSNVNRVIDDIGGDIDSFEYKDQEDVVSFFAYPGEYVLTLNGEFASEEFLIEADGSLDFANANLFDSRLSGMIINVDIAFELNESKDVIVLGKTYENVRVFNESIDIEYNALIGLDTVDSVYYNVLNESIVSGKMSYSYALCTPDMVVESDSAKTIDGMFEPGAVLDVVVRGCGVSTLADDNYKLSLVDFEGTEYEISVMMSDIGASSVAAVDEANIKVQLTEELTTDEYFIVFDSIGADDAATSTVYPISVHSSEPQIVFSPGKNVSFNSGEAGAILHTLRNDLDSTSAIIELAFVTNLSDVRVYLRDGETKRIAQDTNADGIIDTGILGQYESIEVLVEFVEENSGDYYLNWNVFSGDVSVGTRDSINIDLVEVAELLYNDLSIFNMDFENGDVNIFVRNNNPDTETVQVALEVAGDEYKKTVKIEGDSELAVYFDLNRTDKNLILSSKLVDGEVVYVDENVQNNFMTLVQNKEWTEENHKFRYELNLKELYGVNQFDYPVRVEVPYNGSMDLQSLKVVFYDSDGVSTTSGFVKKTPVHKFLSYEEKQEKLYLLFPISEFAANKEIYAYVYFNELDLNDAENREFDATAYIESYNEGVDWNPQVIMDNTDSLVEVIGKWVNDYLISGFFGLDYLIDLGMAKGDKLVVYRVEELASSYELYYYGPKDDSFASGVSVYVHHSKGIDKVILDQQIIGDEWNYIGMYDFDAKSKVVISNEKTSGVVVADAFKLIKVADFVVVKNMEIFGSEEVVPVVETIELNCSVYESNRYFLVNDSFDFLYNLTSNVSLVEVSESVDLVESVFANLTLNDGAGSLKVNMTGAYMINISSSAVLDEFGRVVSCADNRIYTVKFFENYSSLNASRNIDLRLNSVDVNKTLDESLNVTDSMSFNVSLNGSINATNITGNVSEIDASLGILQIVDLPVLELYDNDYLVVNLSDYFYSENLSFQLSDLMFVYKERNSLLTNKSIEFENNDSLQLNSTVIENGIQVHNPTFDYSPIDDLDKYVSLNGSSLRIGSSNVGLYMLKLQVNKGNQSIFVNLSFEIMDSHIEYNSNAVQGKAVVGEPVAWILEEETSEVVLSADVENVSVFDEHNISLDSTLTVQVGDKEIALEDYVVNKKANKQLANLEEKKSEVLIKSKNSGIFSRVGAIIETSSIEREIREVNETVNTSLKLDNVSSIYIKFNTTGRKKIIYETSAPMKKESFENNTFEVYVYSNVSMHYYDIYVNTTVPEELLGKALTLYHYVNGSKNDVISDSRYNVSFKDLDGDGLMEFVEWVVPRLSGQLFEVGEGAGSGVGTGRLLRSAANTVGSDNNLSVTFSVYNKGDKTLGDLMLYDYVPSGFTVPGSKVLVNLSSINDDSRSLSFKNITKAKIKSNYAGTGSNTFVVPADVTEVTIKAWGAGGGGGAQGSNGADVGGAGGAGGYAEGTITVTPGESLPVYVGAGGAGGPTDNEGDGGAGGDHSSVSQAGSPVVIAGAGGGGGGGDNSGDGLGGAGGVGGGSTGGDAPNRGSSTGGTGGTQSAGGTGGSGTSGTGSAGGALSGGAGQNANAATTGGAVNGNYGGAGGLGLNNYGAGGGGGSGYFGGGGGGASISGDTGGSGGGGGSNYVSGTSTVSLQGSGATAANNADEDYVGTVGNGGAGGGFSGSAGSNGRVVIYYQEFAPSSDTVSAPQIFTEVDDSYRQINNITFVLEVDSYDPSASYDQSTTYPDLKLEVFDGSSWVFVGNFNIDATYTGSSLNETNANFTLSTSAPSVLAAWEDVKNQSYRLQAFNLDCINGSYIDDIQIANTRVIIDHESYALAWNVSPMYPDQAKNITYNALAPSSSTSVKFRSFLYSDDTLVDSDVHSVFVTTEGAVYAFSIRSNVSVPKVGEEVEYYIDVMNVGPQTIDASSEFIVDVPSQFSLISTGDGTAIDNKITYGLGSTIVSGATLTKSFVATVNVGGGYAITVNGSLVSSTNGEVVDIFDQSITGGSIVLDTGGAYAQVTNNDNSWAGIGHTSAIGEIWMYHDFGFDVSHLGIDGSQIKNISFNFESCWHDQGASQPTCSGTRPAYTLTAGTRVYDGANYVDFGSSITVPSGANNPDLNGAGFSRTHSKTSGFTDAYINDTGYINVRIYATGTAANNNDAQQSTDYATLSVGYDSDLFSEELFVRVYDETNTTFLEREVPAIYASYQNITNSITVKNIYNDTAVKIILTEKISSVACDDPTSPNFKLFVGGAEVGNFDSVVVDTGNLEITWSGLELQVGESETINYTVQTPTCGVETLYAESFNATVNWEGLNNDAYSSTNNKDIRIAAYNRAFVTYTLVSDEITLAHKTPVSLKINNTGMRDITALSRVNLTHSDNCTIDVSSISNGGTYDVPTKTISWTNLGAISVDSAAYPNFNLNCSQADRLTFDVFSIYADIVGELNTSAPTYLEVINFSNYITTTWSPALIEPSGYTTLTVGIQNPFTSGSISSVIIDANTPSNFTKNPLMQTIASIGVGSSDSKQFLIQANSTVSSYDVITEFSFIDANGVAVTVPITDSILVASQPNLVIVREMAPIISNAGVDSQVRFYVYNNGNDDAYGVVLTENVNKSFWDGNGVVSTVYNGGIANAGADTITWNIGTVKRSNFSLVQYDYQYSGAVTLSESTIYEQGGDIAGWPYDFSSGSLSSSSYLTYGIAGAVDGWDRSEGGTAYDYGDNCNWGTVISGGELYTADANTGDQLASCSYGIEIEVTEDMYNTIIANGEAYVTFYYELQDVGQVTEVEDQFWIKARWHSPLSGEHYLGSDLDDGMSGGDNTFEVVASCDIPGSCNGGLYTGTFLQNVTEWIEGAGTYYLDFGHKTQGSTADENAQARFDNVKFYIEGPKFYEFGSSVSYQDISATGYVSSEDFEVGVREDYDTLEFNLSKRIFNVSENFNLTLEALNVGGDASGTTITFFEDFESGALSSDWTTSNSNVVGRGAPVTNSDVCASVYSGTYSYWMDVTVNNNYNLNELITTQDFTGASNILLSFYYSEQGDENEGASDHIGTQNTDGVFYTCDGNQWYSLMSLVDPAGWTYSGVINISNDPDFCGTIDSNFAIKFTQYDNFGCTSDGRGLDDITIEYHGYTKTDDDPKVSLATTTNYFSAEDPHSYTSGTKTIEFSEGLIDAGTSIGSWFILNSSVADYHVLTARGLADMSYSQNLFILSKSGSFVTDITNPADGQLFYQGDSFSLNVNSTSSGGNVAGCTLNVLVPGFLDVSGSSSDDLGVIKGTEYKESIFTIDSLNRGADNILVSGICTAGGVGQDTVAVNVTYAHRMNSISLAHSELELEDYIQSILVNVTNLANTAHNYNTSIVIKNSSGSVMTFGPYTEIVINNGIAKDVDALANFNNAGSGYLIPSSVKPGVYNVNATSRPDNLDSLWLDTSLRVVEVGVSSSVNDSLIKPGESINVDVNVSNGWTSIVNYAINVSVIHDDRGVDVTHEWGSVPILPTSKNIAGGLLGEFDLNLTAPSNFLKAQGGTYTLNISIGYVDPNGLSKVKYLTESVEIEKVYNFSIDISNPTRVPVGLNTSFDLNITNLGNCFVDDLNLTMAVKDLFGANPNFIISPKLQTMDLLFNESNQTNVYVSVIPSASAGVYNATVYANFSSTKVAAWKLFNVTRDILMLSVEAEFNEYEALDLIDYLNVTINSSSPDLTYSVFAQAGIYNSSNHRQDFGPNLTETAGGFISPLTEVDLLLKNGGASYVISQNAKPGTYTIISNVTTNGSVVYYRNGSFDIVSVNPSSEVKPNNIEYNESLVYNASIYNGFSSSIDFNLSVNVYNNLSQNRSSLFNYGTMPTFNVLGTGNNWGSTSVSPKEAYLVEYGNYTIEGGLSYNNPNGIFKRKYVNSSFYIKPYKNLTGTAKIPTFTTSQMTIGISNLIVVVIENLGNIGLEDVATTLRIYNSTGDEMGWAMTPSPSFSNISFADDTEVNFDVTVPPGAPPGNYTANISIYYNGSETNYFNFTKNFSVSETIFMRVNLSQMELERGDVLDNITANLTNINTDMQVFNVTSRVEIYDSTDTFAPFGPSLSNVRNTWNLAFNKSHFLNWTNSSNGFRIPENAPLGDYLVQVVGNLTNIGTSTTFMVISPKFRIVNVSASSKMNQSNMKVDDVVSLNVSIKNGYYDAIEYNVTNFQVWDSFGHEYTPYWTISHGQRSVNVSGEMSNYTLINFTSPSDPVDVPAGAYLIVGTYNYTDKYGRSKQRSFNSSIVVDEYRDVNVSIVLPSQTPVGLNSTFIVNVTNTGNCYFNTTNVSLIIEDYSGWKITPTWGYLSVGYNSSNTSSFLVEIPGNVSLVGPYFVNASADTGQHYFSNNKVFNVEQLLYTKNINLGYAEVEPNTNISLSVIVENLVLDRNVDVSEEITVYDPSLIVVPWVTSPVGGTAIMDDNTTVGLDNIQVNSTAEIGNYTVSVETLYGLYGADINTTKFIVSTIDTRNNVNPRAVNLGNDTVVTLFFDNLWYSKGFTDINITLVNITGSDGKDYTVNWTVNSTFEQLDVSPRSTANVTFLFNTTDSSLSGGYYYVTYAINYTDPNLNRVIEKFEVAKIGYKNDDIFSEYEFPSVIYQGDNFAANATVFNVGANAIEDIDVDLFLTDASGNTVYHYLSPGAYTIDLIELSGDNKTVVYVDVPLDLARGTYTAVINATFIDNLTLQQNHTFKQNFTVNPLMDVDILASGREYAILDTNQTVNVRIHVSDYASDVLSGVELNGKIYAFNGSQYWINGFTDVSGNYDLSLPLNVIEGGYYVNVTANYSTLPTVSREAVILAENEKKVLVVADDNSISNGPGGRDINAVEFYNVISNITEFNINTTIHTVSADGVPSTALLNQYDAVVWSLGNSLNNLIDTGNGEYANLKNYITNGGGLVIEADQLTSDVGVGTTDSEVLLDITKTNIVSSSMRIATIGDDLANVEKAQFSHPVLDGFGGEVGARYHVTDDSFYEDRIQPNVSQGTVSFAYWANYASYSAGTYNDGRSSLSDGSRIVYYPFSIDGLYDPYEEYSILNSVIWSMKKKFAVIPMCNVSSVEIYDYDNSDFVSVEALAKGAEGYNVSGMVGGSDINLTVVASDGFSQSFSISEFEGNYNGTVSFNRTGVNVINVSANQVGHKHSYGFCKVIVFERASPLLEIVNPLMDLNVSQDTVVFEFNITDTLSDVANCSLYINDNLNQTNSSIVENSVSNFTVTFVDGVYNWRINCSDEFGNYNGTLNKVVKIDTLPPNVTLVSPVFNERILSVDEFVVNATVSDELNNVDEVRFEYREDAVSSWKSICNLTSAPYNCTWDLSALSDGLDYQVRVVANDSLNNVNASENATSIIIDRNPPTLLYWNLTTFDGVVIPNASNITKGNVFRVASKWYDLFKFSEAYLEHNGSSAFVNYSVSFVDAQTIWANYTMDTTNNSEFATLGPISVAGMYINDSSGNSVVSTPSYEFNLWSIVNMSSISVSSSKFYTTEVVNASCGVVDNFTGVGIGGVNVSFYYDGNYLGSSDTNSTGFADLSFNISPVGTYNLICNITDEVELYYYANPMNDLQQSVTVRPFNISIFATPNGSVVDRDSADAVDDDSILLQVQIPAEVTAANISFYANVSDPAVGQAGLLLGYNDSAANIVSVVFDPSSGNYSGNYTWWANATYSDDSGLGNFLVYGSFSVGYLDPVFSPDTKYFAGETVWINSTATMNGPESLGQFSSLYSGILNATLRSRSTSHDLVLEYNGSSWNNSYDLVIPELGEWNVTVNGTANYFYPTNSGFRSFDVYAYAYALEPENGSVVDRDSVSAKTDSLRLILNVSGIPNVNLSYLTNISIPALGISNLVLGSNVSNASGLAEFYFDPNSSIYAGEYEWFGNGSYVIVGSRKVFEVYGGFDLNYSDVNYYPNETYMSDSVFVVYSNLTSFGVESSDELNSTYGSRVSLNLSHGSYVINLSLVYNGSHWVNDSYLLDDSLPNGVWGISLNASGNYFFNKSDIVRNFTLIRRTNLSIFDEVDSGDVARVFEQVNFSANYTDVLGNPIDGSCYINFTDSSGIMSFNLSGRNLYSYQRNFTSNQVYTWNVTCNRTYFETKKAVDSVVISKTHVFVKAVNGSIIDRDSVSGAESDIIILNASIPYAPAGVSISLYSNRTAPTIDGDFFLGSNVTNAEGYTLIYYNPGSSMYAGNYTFFGNASVALPNGTSYGYIYGGLNLTYKNISANPNSGYLVMTVMEIENLLNSLGDEPAVDLNSSYNCNVNANILQANGSAFDLALGYNSSDLWNRSYFLDTSDFGYWNISLNATGDYFFSDSIESKNFTIKVLLYLDGPANGTIVDRDSYTADVDSIPLRINFSSVGGQNIAFYVNITSPINLGPILIGSNITDASGIAEFWFDGVGYYAGNYTWWAEHVSPFSELVGLKNFINKGQMYMSFANASDYPWIEYEHNSTIELQVNMSSSKETINELAVNYSMGTVVNASFVIGSTVREYEIVPLVGVTWNRSVYFSEVDEKGVWNVSVNLTSDYFYPEYISRVFNLTKYNSTLDGWDQTYVKGGKVPAYLGHNISFYSNYTSLIGDLVNSADCRFSISDGTEIGTGRNWALDLYVNDSKRFVIPGLHTWNLTCNSTLYKTKRVAGALRIYMKTNLTLDYSLGRFNDDQINLSYDLYNNELHNSTGSIYGYVANQYAVDIYNVEPNLTSISSIPYFGNISGVVYDVERKNNDNLWYVVNGSSNYSVRDLYRVGI